MVQNKQNKKLGLNTQIYIFNAMSDCERKAAYSKFSENFTGSLKYSEKFVTPMNDQKVWSQTHYPHPLT